MLKKIYKENKQFIDYSLVSLFCTGTLYFLYFFITWITDGRYLVANFIAYVVSFTVLYVLDQKVFEAMPKNIKHAFGQLSTFVIFRVFGFIIDSSLLILFIEQFGLSNFVSKLSSSMITFIFNYVTNKFFVFKTDIYKLLKSGGKNVR